MELDLAHDTLARQWNVAEISLLALGATAVTGLYLVTPLVFALSLVISVTDAVVLAAVAFAVVEVAVLRILILTSAGPGVSPRQLLHGGVQLGGRRSSRRASRLRLPEEAPPNIPPTTERRREP